MEKLISNVSPFLITLSIHIVLALLGSFILVPIILKLVGFKKRNRNIAARFCMAILLIVIFINVALQM